MRTGGASEPEARIASFASSGRGWPVRLGEEPQQGHEGPEAGEAEADNPAQSGEFGFLRLELGGEFGLVGFEGGDDGVAGHVANPFHRIVASSGLRSGCERACRTARESASVGGVDVAMRPA